MIRFVAPIVFAALISIAVPEAEAQMSGAAMPYGGTEVFVGSSRVYPAANAVFYSPSATTSTYIPPYSYYTAPFPLPARPYVGYGSNDIFPYYGRPYGHPYDAWTWSYMSAYPTDYLARYYYPPVR